MASPPTSRRMAAPAAIGLLVILALVPARFHFYGPLVSDVTAWALYPITWPLSTASEWVEEPKRLPELGTVDELSDMVRVQQGEIQRLTSEIERMRQLMAEFGALRKELGETPKYIPVTVIGAAADAGARTVQIDRGTADGIEQGMAVVDGRYLALVGRVVQVSRNSATVKPLTTPGTQLEVMLTPDNGKRASAARATKILLEYEDPGVFVAPDAKATMPAAKGDLARLQDFTGVEAWPSVVQGMIVGVVRSAEIDPDDELRQRIEVEPIRSLRVRDTVMVVVPRGREDTGAEGGER